MRDAGLWAGAVVMGLVGSAGAAELSVQFDPDQTEIVLDSPTSDEDLHVSATGGGVIALDSATSPTTAGIVSISGVVPEALDRELPDEGTGIVQRFRADAGSIQFTATGQGSLANPLDPSGRFDQAVSFTFAGMIEVALLAESGGDPLLTFPVDLSLATVTQGAVLDDAELRAVGSDWEVALPLDMVLEIPLEEIGAVLALDVGGQVVAQTPEPAAATLLAIGGGALLTRRRTAGG